MKVLITEERIAQIVLDLGKKISDDYIEEGVKDIVVVNVLKGGFLFLADLVRKFTVPRMRFVEFVKCSSYEGTESSGVVKFTQDISQMDIRGRDVLIVEDIVDTGRTLATLLEILRDLEPRSIKVVTFLDKPSKRKPGFEVPITYIGREIEDVFVVGYGMDYKDLYRNLPYVGILDICPKCREGTEEINIGWFRSEARPRQVQCLHCDTNWYIWETGEGREVFVNVTEYEERREREYDLHDPNELLLRIIKEQATVN